MARCRCRWLETSQSTSQGRDIIITLEVWYRTMTYYGWTQDDSRNNIPFAGPD